MAKNLQSFGEHLKWAYTLAIGISSTQCGLPSLGLIGSRDFGGTRCASHSAISLDPVSPSLYPWFGWDNAWEVTMVRPIVLACLGTLAIAQRECSDATRRRPRRSHIHRNADIAHQTDAYWRRQRLQRDELCHDGNQRCGKSCLKQYGWSLPIHPKRGCNGEDSRVRTGSAPTAITTEIKSSSNATFCQVLLTTAN